MSISNSAMLVEPYTVMQIEKVREIKYSVDPYTHDLIRVSPRLFRFRVYYRNYTKMKYTFIDAKDELEAYILGQKHISKTRTAYDRRKAKKEQTS